MTMALLMRPASTRANPMAIAAAAVKIHARDRPGRGSGQPPRRHLQTTGPQAEFDLVESFLLILGKGHAIHRPATVAACGSPTTATGHGDECNSSAATGPNREPR